MRMNRVLPLLGIASFFTVGIQFQDVSVEPTVQEKVWTCTRLMGGATDAELTRDLVRCARRFDYTPQEEDWP